MGTITYCDIDDCRNTQEEQKMYDMQWNMNNNVHKILGMRKYDDICQECVDMINSEYKEDNPLVILSDDTYINYLIPNPAHVPE